MLFYWSTCVDSSPSLLRSTWKKSSLLSPVVSLKSSRRQKKRSSCHQTPYNKNPTRFSSGRKHLRKYILSVYYSPSSLLQTAPTEAYVFLVCWYVCVILCCGKPWLLLLNILTDWLIMLLPTPAKVAVLQAWKKHETEVCLSFDSPWFLDDLKKSKHPKHSHVSPSKNTFDSERVYFPAASHLSVSLLFRVWILLMCWDQLGKDPASCSSVF